MMEGVDPAHVFEVFRHLCRGLDPFDLKFEQNQKNDVDPLTLKPIVGVKDSKQSLTDRGEEAEAKVHISQTQKEERLQAKSQQPTDDKTTGLSTFDANAPTSSVSERIAPPPEPRPTQDIANQKPPTADKGASLEETDRVLAESSGGGRLALEPLRSNQGLGSSVSGSEPSDSRPQDVSVTIGDAVQSSSSHSGSIRASSPNKERIVQEMGANISAISLSPVQKQRKERTLKLSAFENVQKRKPGLSVNGSVNAGTAGGFAFSTSALSSGVSSLNTSALPNKRRLTSLTPAAERKKRDLSAFDFDEDELDQSILFRKQVIEKNHLKAVTPQTRLLESLKTSNISKSGVAEGTNTASVPLQQQPARPPAAPPNNTSSISGINIISPACPVRDTEERDRIGSPARACEKSPPRQPPVNDLDFAFNLRVFSSGESSSDNDGGMSDGSTELNRQAHLMLDGSP